MSDNINPDHYKNNSIKLEPYVLCSAFSFTAGNVLKYVIRYKDKNGDEDLRKALRYFDMMNPEDTSTTPKQDILLELWAKFSDNVLISKAVFSADPFFIALRDFITSEINYEGN
jgi:hypothetical protein